MSFCYSLYFVFTPLNFQLFKFMFCPFPFHIYIHLSSLIWQTNTNNATHTATPHIATLTCNIHTCPTMVSNSECTTLIPIVPAATNLKFSTQIFIMLLKIWMSLVSQRPIRLRNLKSKSKAIITLRSCVRRRLLPDLTRGA